MIRACKRHIRGHEGNWYVFNMKVSKCNDISRNRILTEFLPTVSLTLCVQPFSLSTLHGDCKHLSAL